MKRPEKIWYRNSLVEIAEESAFISRMIYEHSFQSHFKVRYISAEAVQGMGSTMACVITTAEAIYVAFRGTDPTNQSQVYSDLKCSWILEPRIGYISAGFRQEIDYFYIDVVERLDHAIRTKRRPVYITGHSLGGALATLFSARMTQRWIETNQKKYVPSGLITFGSPRVGDADFKKHVELGLSVLPNESHRIGIWRFVNNNDIIPRMPSRLFGFRHVGLPLYIDPQCNIWENPWLYRRLWWRIVGRWPNILTDGIEDHKMINYELALQKNFSEL